MRRIYLWKKLSMTLTLAIVIFGLVLPDSTIYAKEIRTLSLFENFISKALEYSEQHNRSEKDNSPKASINSKITLKTGSTSNGLHPKLTNWVALPSIRDRVREWEIQSKNNQNKLNQSGKNQAKKSPSTADTLQRSNPSSAVLAAPDDGKVLNTMSVMATGYTAGYESTGKKKNHPQYGITYSGVKVRRDKSTVSTIAADLRLFPLGTILYIPGYGYGVVADKGSAIKGKKIDLYFSTTKQVFKEWGKKKVEVQIVKRGRGKLTEAMLKELGRAMQVNKEVPPNVWEESI